MKFEAIEELSTPERIESIVGVHSFGKWYSRRGQFG